MKKNTITQDQVNDLVYNHLIKLQRASTKNRIIERILAPKYKTIKALTALRKSKKLALIVCGSGIKRHVYWGVI